MKHLFVVGEKDGIKRRVEHQPMNAAQKQTPSGPDHWWMWLHHEQHGRVYTTIRRDKVQQETE